MSLLTHMPHYGINFHFSARTGLDLRTLTQVITWETRGHLRDASARILSWAPLRAFPVPG